ncbi:MAG: ABC transporter ATP-binding protein [Myxococcales bacterium FL481]|nr:MAG: ABC transporter ATP-binding protein [Myxococcales bacterium FL481]
MSSNDDASRPVTIRAEGISKVYGDFVALHDVSFSVRKGTIAAFLGPNGAGKSTTMKILTGYLAPTAGRARMLGLDPGQADERHTLAEKLGYLPENGPLYPDMTPYELFEFVGEVRSVPNLLGAIDRVVGQCALESVLHKPIRKLSKGFRQRVGMANALLHDPEVLVLDEPTSGLDPLQIREVRGLIRKLGESKTVLLSTHILQEVEAVADEVIVVAEGRVAFTGSLDELKGDRTLEERFYELAGDKAAKRKEVA